MLWKVLKITWIFGFDIMEHAVNRVGSIKVKHKTKTQKDIIKKSFLACLMSVSVGLRSSTSVCVTDNFVWQMIWEESYTIDSLKIEIPQLCNEEKKITRKQRCCTKSLWAALSESSLNCGRTFPFQFVNVLFSLSLLEGSDKLFSNYLFFLFSFFLQVVSMQWSGFITVHI